MDTHYSSSYVNLLETKPVKEGARSREYGEIGEEPSEKRLRSCGSGWEAHMRIPYEWTIGSLSPVSSKSLSPVDDHQSIIIHPEFVLVLLRRRWERETLASHSDTEAQR